MGTAAQLQFGQGHVQRWRPGTAPLPAASQELLTGRSLGTGAFLEIVVALREGWLKAETAFSGA